jgi:hypothetical protein
MCPIFAAYESLGIELLQNASPSEKQLIQQRLRIIYPKPTVWFSHPMILVTQRGEQLAKALRDPEIQAIAWRKHGFRAPLLQQDPAATGFPGIAPEITSVMPLPAYTVLDDVTNYLSQCLGAANNGKAGG